MYGYQVHKHYEGIVVIMPKGPIDIKEGRPSLPLDLIERLRGNGALKDPTAPNGGALSAETAIVFGDIKLSAGLEETLALFANGNNGPVSRVNKIPLPDFLSPCPSISARTRVKMSRAVPQELRSLHTQRMMEIDDLISFFASLSLSNIDEAIRDGSFAKNAYRLLNLGWEIIDVYTVSKSFPAEEIAYLVNMAYAGNAGKNVARVRVDLDITSLNGVDSTGSLVDTYLPLVREFMAEVSISNRFKFETRAPQLSDRTSFAISGPADKKFLNDLLQEIVLRFVPEMTDKLKEAQARGEILDQVDIDSLPLTGTITYSTLKFKDRAERLIAKNGLRTAHQIPRDEILKMVLAEIRESNAATIFIKANTPDKPPEMFDAGLSVYGDSFLPTEGGMLDILKKFIADGRGTIPFGVFGFDKETTGDDIGEQQRVLLEFPDYPHERGALYGHKRGLFEIFQLHVSTLIKEGTGNLSFIKRLAEDIGLRLLNLGAAGMRDPRAPSIVRETRNMINLAGEQEWFDPFIETLVTYEREFGVPCKYLVLFEIDDAKAFLSEYPPDDDVDERFQRLKERIHFSARRSDIIPVMAAEGDQIRTAPLRAEGLESAVTFARDGQRLIREHYAGMKFQVYGKLKIGDRVVRLPKWVNPETGEEIVAREAPEGFISAEKGVTATAVVVPIPSIRTREDAALVNEKIRLGFAYIDVLKGKCPFIKEQFGILPQDFTNGHERRP